MIFLAAAELLILDQQRFWLRLLLHRKLQLPAPVTTSLKLLMQRGHKHLKNSSNRLRCFLTSRLRS